MAAGLVKRASYCVNKCQTDGRFSSLNPLWIVLSDNGKSSMFGWLLSWIEASLLRFILLKFGPRREHKWPRLRSTKKQLDWYHEHSKLSASYYAFKRVMPANNLNTQGWCNEASGDTRLQCMTSTALPAHRSICFSHRGGKNSVLKLLRKDKERLNQST